MPDDDDDAMSGTDKLALIEARDDGTTLIRGTGFAVLAQFNWAVIVPAGIVVPDTKLPTAAKQLKAMGYTLTSPAGDPPPRGTRATPLPLPECAACTGPYPRSHTPRDDEECQHCGQPLRLVQWDPARNRFADDPRPDAPLPLPECAGCGLRYPHGYPVDDGETCPDCGAALKLLTWQPPGTPPTPGAAAGWRAWIVTETARRHTMTPPAAPLEPGDPVRVGALVPHALTPAARAEITAAQHRNRQLALTPTDTEPEDTQP